MTIPAASTGSVNAYEESAELGSGGFRQRIIDELSAFGDVVSIDGTIDNTQRHGILLQDVVATVHHPWIRTPMRIDVRWDSASRSPIYRNELKIPVCIEQSYGSDDSLTVEDERILDLTMERITSHPAWDLINPAATQDGAARRPAMLAGGVGGALMGAGTGAFLWDPMMAIMGATAIGMAGVTGFTADRLISNSLRSRLREINAGVKSWNAHPRETFDSLFRNNSERSTFLDALLSACAAAGIEYRGDVQLTSPWIRSVGQNWSYRDTANELVNANGDLLAPLAGAMVVFQGEMSPHYEAGEMLFDGRRFFLCTKKGESYLVCPIG